MSRRVVVVGGGVVGAACAYYLSKAGCPVTLVDKGELGAACSHGNCGYVCPSHILPLAGPGVIGATLKTLLQRNSPLKVRPLTLLKNLRWFLKFAGKCNQADLLRAGDALAPILNSSRSLYSDLIAGERMDCEWQTDGLLFVFRHHKPMNHYAETDRMLTERYQMSAKRFDGEALRQFEPSLKHGIAGGWLYTGDAHLRPDRLMQAWRPVLLRLGVELRERCEVIGFARSDAKIRSVITSTGEIEADCVVLAAGAWTPQISRELAGRLLIQPGKGYSITYGPQPDGPKTPMIFEEHRVAVTPFGSGYRIGSTMEFAGYDASMNRDRLKLLIDGAAVYMKNPPSGPVSEEWWGWRPMTPDSLPVIGPSRNASNAFIAAGHGMLGLTLAPATGRLIAEMVTGQLPHIDPAPYSPARF